ncbi:MAG: ester cyclase family protein [Gemmatimonadota bacterium]
MSLDGAEGVRALYEALAEGEFERAAGAVSENVRVLNVATGDIHSGRAGFLVYHRGWAAAFPDLTMQLSKIDVGDRRAVAEYELQGSHTGPLVTPRGHIPPTGMDVQVRFCDVLEIRDVEVAHIRSYFDSNTLLRQLGLVSGSPLHAPDRRAPLELYAQALDGNATERHKAIVSRFVQEVLNRQNPQAAADTCGRDYRWHGGTLGEAKGLPAFQTVLSTFFIAFPDIEVQILDVIAEGDRVVVRFSMSGTHLGEFQGIAPTFKRVTAGGTSTFRVEESRIVEEWWQGDVLLLLQQMDATPPRLRLSR